MAFTNTVQAGQSSPDDLQTRKDLLNSEIASLESKKEELKVALSTSDLVSAQADSAKLDLATTQAAHQAALAQVAEVTKQIEDLKASKVGVHGEITFLDAKKTEAALEYGKMQTLFTGISTSVESSKRDLATAQFTLDGVNSAITAKQGNLDGVNAGIALAVAEAARLSSLKDQLKTDIDVYQASKDSVSQESLALEAKIAELKSEVENLQSAKDAIVNQTTLEGQIFEKNQSDFAVESKAKLEALEAREGAVSVAESRLESKAQELRDAKAGMEKYFNKTLPNIII